MNRVFFMFNGDSRHVDLPRSQEEIAAGFWLSSKLEPELPHKYWIPPSALLHIMMAPTAPANDKVAPSAQQEKRGEHRWELLTTTQGETIYEWCPDCGALQVITQWGGEKVEIRRPTEYHACDKPR